MEKYEQSGLAQFPGDESGVREVTQNGVTISVARTIIDNYYAYVSFRIEGFDIKAGETTGFETHHCTLDGKEVSNLSSFYARNVLDENGQPVFRDDELVQNYVLEDGTWRFENTNTSGEYELLFTTNRILDVSQVESLLFWKNACKDEDGEDAQYTLNDFYEVPFN